MNRRDKLPRKLKKGMDGLRIDMRTGKVEYSWEFSLRSYPRTKWVVRAERQFHRLFREYLEKDKIIQELTMKKEELDVDIKILKMFPLKKLN